MSATEGAGAKEPEGFYIYPEGREADPRVCLLIGQDAEGCPDEDEISRRPVWQMINQVAHCLEEGVVASPEEADLGVVLGLGWPHTLGGPLTYARQVDAGTIVTHLEAWQEKYGPRFRPSRVLVEMS